MTSLPEDVRCVCHVCEGTVYGLEALAEHMENAHGIQMMRWPDGGLVVDETEML